MIAMSGEKISTCTNCIPAVELRHWLDPLDTDGGPFQRLALRSVDPGAEPVHKTVPVSVSGTVSDTPDAGYPLAV